MRICLSEDHQVVTDELIRPYDLPDICKCSKSVVSNLQAELCAYGLMKFLIVSVNISELRYATLEVL